MGLQCIAPAYKPTPFEILIVEDHPMMIRSITNSLEVLHLRAQVGCSVMVVSTMRQARKRLQGREPPSLIISDLHLPDSRGLGTLHALLVEAPGTPIVVFSACDDKSTERAALALGARAFVSKSALAQDFVQKIRPFLTMLEPGVGADSPQALPCEPPHPVALLTDRQREVLMEVAHGYRDREIALRLKIGPETVRSHLNAVFHHLGVQNRTQASSVYVAWAKNNGLLV